MWILLLCIVMFHVEIVLRVLIHKAFEVKDKYDTTGLRDLKKN